MRKLISCKKETISNKEKNHLLLSNIFYTPVFMGDILREKQMNSFYEIERGLKHKVERVMLNLNINFIQREIKQRLKNDR